MNQIVKIEELTGVKFAPHGQLEGSEKQRLGMNSMINQISCYSEYNGFQITTSEHEYLLLIENGQSCCETWGYTETNDDPKEFIGANVIDVKFTDTALKTDKLEVLLYNGKIDVDSGGIQFVDFETDKGVLQFAVYNAHNGYYGHAIVFAQDKMIMLSNVL